MSTFLRVLVVSAAAAAGVLTALAVTRRHEQAGMPPEEPEGASSSLEARLEALGDDEGELSLRDQMLLMRELAAHLDA